MLSSISPYRKWQNRVAERNGYAQLSFEFDLLFFSYMSLIPYNSKKFSTAEAAVVFDGCRDQTPAVERGDKNQNKTSHLKGRILSSLQ